MRVGIWLGFKPAISGGAQPMPQVTLMLLPVGSVVESDPIGTVVATFETNATGVTLGGLDSSILAVDGDTVVTTAALTGRESISFTITGTREGYQDNTKSAEVPVEAVPLPDFSVDDVQGTAVVSGTGDITWTITEPDGYIGEYSTDQSEEYSGPLNIEYTETVAPQCIKPPVIARTGGPDDHVGATYTATPGLWQVSGEISMIGAWYLDETPTGVTDLTYNSDEAGELIYAEAVVQTGLASRFAISNSIEITETTETRTFFNFADGTPVSTISDPTGRVWNRGTVQQSFQCYNGFVRNRYGRSNPYFLAPNNAPTGGNQWTRMQVRMAATGETWAQHRVGPAIHTMPTTTDYQGYMVWFETSGRWVLALSTNAVPYTKLTETGVKTYAASQELTVEIRREGTAVVVLVDGVEEIRVTNTGLTGGYPGLAGANQQTGTSLQHNSGWYSFDCGVNE